MSEPRELLHSVKELRLLVGALLLLALAWHIAEVLLLLFGGVLMCLVLRALATPLHRRLHLPPPLALGVVVVLLLVVFVGGSWFAGAAAAEQLQVLRQTLPRALATLREWIAGLPLGRWLLDSFQLERLLPEDWSRLAGLASGTVNMTLGVIGAPLLVSFIGLYLAADTSLYRRGLVRLVPARHRPKAERTLDALGGDLSRWLLGQAVSMTAVGVLTAAGLAALGLPLVLTLSVIAALFDFVPYIGPIASGVLVVLIALTEGERSALLALAWCVAVQQIEAYVVQPIVQRWAVRLAPVLGLLSVVVFGLLFGLPGVLLAAPLMVACVTLARCLLVPALDRDVDVDVDVDQRSVAR